MKPKKSNESLFFSKDVPAISLRKINNGEILSIDKGLRSIDFNQQITSDDKWHLGSCTKTMTSYLIALLIQEGKLSWITSVKEIFKDVKFQGKNGDITILDLLTHRSGLVEPTEFQAFWESAFTTKEDPRTQRTAFLNLLFQKESLFPSGEQNSYSNSGYIVLGAIIEKISNQTWEQFIEAKLFKPLNMNSCGFGAAQPKLAGEPLQTVGHIVSGGQLKAIMPSQNEKEPSDNPAFMGPAGTVHCSMKSWGNFLNEMLMASKDKSIILKSEISKKLFSEYKDKHSYGGWGIVNKDWAHGSIYTMVGSNTLNYALYIIAPEKNSIYFGAVNSGSDEALKTLTAEIKKIID